MEAFRLIADTLRRTGLPFPAPRGAVYRWAEPLRLPSRGRLYIYTGALYQLAPYIEGLRATLDLFSRHPRLASLALRAASPLAPLAAAVARPDPEAEEHSRAALTAMARLLQAAGAEPAYLYSDDLYSGILLHDLGMEEEFAEHARRVHARLLERGATRLVTVDPHTTYALSELYPRYVDGYRLEVRSYLEVLVEAVEAGRLSFPGGERGPLAIHDPCYYARYLGVVEQPRRLLRAAGYTLAEPRRSGRLTACCGGPVEALSPRLARRVAEARAGELARAARRVATLCPICWANLHGLAGIEARDAAIYLWEAYRGGAKH